MECHVKSEPLEYYPFTVNPNPFPIVFGENEIRIPSESFGAVEGADYQIIPMNAYSSVPVKSGRVDAQTIDISELDKDTYSIRFVKAGEGSVSLSVSEASSLKPVDLR